MAKFVPSFYRFKKFVAAAEQDAIINYRLRICCYSLDNTLCNIIIIFTEQWCKQICYHKVESTYTLRRPHLGPLQL